MKIRPGKNHNTIDSEMVVRAAGSGRPRMPRNPDGSSRFRGPGRGKKDYVATDGRNPTRTMNGGRI